ncbi:Low affinity iron permease, partial [Basidiobolus meristosporus CBS 931.73]
MSNSNGPSDAKVKRLCKKIFDDICSPGRQYAIQSAATTQFVAINKAEAIAIMSEQVPSSGPCSEEMEKRSMGGRFFDCITEYAGSRFIFVSTLATLVGWAIAGIFLGAPANWQIAMQDGSSIQCYISDTLLMRQQQNHCDRLLTIIAQLRSRNTTCRRLLRDPTMIAGVAGLKKNTFIAQELKDDVGDAVKLPLENWFDKSCNFVSILVGSIYSLIFYWAGIFVWIGMGYPLGWSNMWQLYINTAVAIELTFTSMFLQHTRRSHMEYFEKCLTSVLKADCELEILMRKITGDNVPNPVVRIEPLKVSLGVRSIDYYADLVGSGVGAFISISVFVAWLAVGKCMQWNSNWWLIIGTYTGLVGFIDGFVLRNVYFRQDKILSEQFQELIDADMEVFQYLNLQPPTEPLSTKESLI